MLEQLLKLNEYSTVNELQPLSFTKYLNEITLLITILLIIGTIFILLSRKKNKTLILLWLGVTIITPLIVYRLIYLAIIPITITAATSINITEHKKKTTIIILLLLLTFIPTIIQKNNNITAHLMNDNTENTCEFIKKSENSNKILTSWDQGHIIQYHCQKKTLAAGDPNAFHYQNIIKALTNNNKTLINTALETARIQNLTIILTDKMMQQQGIIYDKENPNNPKIPTTMTNSLMIEMYYNNAKKLNNTQLTHSSELPYAPKTKTFNKAFLPQYFLQSFQHPLILSQQSHSPSGLPPPQL